MLKMKVPPNELLKTKGQKNAPNKLLKISKLSNFPNYFIIHKELAAIFTLIPYADGPIRGNAVVRMVPGGECARPMEASSGPTIKSAH
jgi:hypothetical protein